MNSDKTRLNVGLPKGSLNQRGRGETKNLLEQARYDVRGYEPGAEDARELRFANDAELKPYLIRPQMVGIEMFDKGTIDVAIIGSDWAEEWKLSGRNLELLVPLSYGRAKVVFATSDRDTTIEDVLRGSPIRGYTELPNVTENYLKGFSSSSPSWFFRERMLKQGDGAIELVISEGLTESYLQKGDAAFVVDIVQSGLTLQQNGGTILDTILNSEAGLYASPVAMKDFAKLNKAREFGDMLESVVNARNRQFYTMNVPSDNLSEFLSWLVSNSYCAKEPTVSRNNANAVVSVLVQQSQIPKFLPGVAAFGARDIVAIDTTQVYAPSGGDAR